MDDDVNLLQFDGGVYRNPTAILFDENGIVVSFGYNARCTARSLDDKNTYVYFERLEIQDEFVELAMKIKAENGKEYYLVEVIAHILKYLKDELIRQLNASGMELEATDFDWVITVPAIWRARGKQIMREAGYKAGLCSIVSCCDLREVSANQYPHIPELDHPDKLTLVLQLEATAVYCQNMIAKQQAKLTSKCCLVVNIGRNTVDILVYRINEEHIEVIYESVGTAWGSTKVHQEFKRFLESITEDENFSKLVGTCSDHEDKCQAILDRIIYKTFECKMIGFNDKLSSIMIELPYQFLMAYGHQIQGQNHVSVCVTELRITHEKFRSFFHPVIDDIIECVEEVLNVVTEVDTIHLVQEIECNYIYEQLKAHFGKRYVIFSPYGQCSAAVKGAAMIGRNPKFLHHCIDTTHLQQKKTPIDSSLENVQYTSGPGGDYRYTQLQASLKKENLRERLERENKDTYEKMKREMDKMQKQLAVQPIFPIMSHGVTTTELPALQKQADKSQAVRSLTSRPTLPELLRFDTSSGRSVNIVQEIGTYYSTLGPLLLKDDRGAVTGAIIREHHHNANAINQEILTRWLQGQGKRPVTWSTLIDVLKDIDLAQVIQEALTSPEASTHNSH